MEPHILGTIVSTIAALVLFLLENRSRSQAERVKILERKLDEVRRLLENGRPDVP